MNSQHVVKVTMIILSCVAILAILGGIAFGIGYSVLHYDSSLKEGNVNKISKLNISDDGSFRVLQITDTHLISNGWKLWDNQTLRWIEEAIDRTHPDLVEMSGDITGNGVKDRNQGILAVANLLEKKKVYWAYTFGNHDGEHTNDEHGKDIQIGKYGNQTEVSTVCKNAHYDTTQGTLFYGDNTKANEELFELLKGYEYCLTRRDVLETEHAREMGVGNYVIDLVDKNDNVRFGLIHMDTHGKMYYDNGTKDYVDSGYVGLTTMQVEWYESVVKKYAENGIKSALFMHIPHYGFRELVEDENNVNKYGIPQFKEKSDVASKVNKFKNTNFMKNEGIYGPRWNDGLEDVMNKYPSTNLVAVGHDHNNCFFLRKNIAKTGTNDVILAYGRCSGVNAWGRTVNIGATVYDINTNGSTIDEIYTIEEIYPSFEYSSWHE